LAKNGKEFLGKPIDIHKRNCGTTVYVDSLWYNVSNSALRNHFIRCGEIKCIRWYRDKDTQKFKGCAWIKFAEFVGAQKAVALSGTTLNARKIYVNHAQQMWQEH